jgi:hypothetical protein
MILNCFQTNLHKPLPKFRCIKRRIPEYNFLFRIVFGLIWLFEVKIKNKPNICFPKSFSHELGGVSDLRLHRTSDSSRSFQSLLRDSAQLPNLTCMVPYYGGLWNICSQSFWKCVNLTWTRAPTNFSLNATEEELIKRYKIKVNFKKKDHIRKININFFSIPNLFSVEYLLRGPW